MIKIDFHIHTIKSELDSSFSFSLDKITDYVEQKKLDAIAITNHNLFDKENYLLVANHLQIPVYPGIEISLEKGHILVISPLEDLDVFEEQCKKIEEEFAENGDIDLNCFLEIFTNLKDYLLIPHYDKNPKIQKFVLDRLDSFVFCGEVANSKKFVRLYKDKTQITPVFFSDMRMSDGSKLSNQQIYLDISESSFSSIKECLRDKEKVFLNKKKNRDLFPILDDGTLASTGLNVIFGKRSTGKTFTLDHIFDNFGNVKYIRQFELIEKDKEQAKRDFDEKLSSDKRLYSEEYLKEFKDLVEDVCSLDFHQEETIADDYVSSLTNYAIDSNNHDSFAKVPLFSDQEFSIVNDEKIIELIKSVLCLLEPGDHKDLIFQYLEHDSLVNLLAALVYKFRDEIKKTTIKQTTNNIITKIKGSLSVESAQSSISSFDMIKYGTQIKKKHIFEYLCKKMQDEQVLLESDVGRFKIVAKRVPILSASVLQGIVGKKGEYKIAFDKYDTPYEYLESLQKLPHIQDDVVYKCFCLIDYQVLNENGLEVSGGERAEFNLENSLKNADNFDMLLIDELESSFDNVFLRNDVNNRIFELTKRMPVFISTHNSVVGGSINANYVLYTEMKYIDKKPSFLVYGGLKADKHLKTVDGDKTNSYDVLINCLEGGEKSYGERKETYENLKN